MKKNHFRLLLLLVFLPSVYFTQIINNQVSYGTLSYDNPHVLKLSDGTFLIGTSNPAGISGTKSCMSYGNSDMWLFKMDVNNNILWQLCFGGSEEENLTNIVETEDGHILVCGRSNSPISGNKTVGTYGGYDFWVIKMDLDGNEVWQRNYGTSQNDAWPFITIVNSDNYILLSSSIIGIDEDKTEESYGSSDYWVLSIDGNGSKLWDKTIGGSGQEIINREGYFDSVEEVFYIGGYSNSEISGLKSEASFGVDDIWVVAIDLQGNLINQKTLGGSLGDTFVEMIINNSEMTIVGISNSPISGNKTAVNFGGNDIWIIRLNQNLEILQDFTFGGSESDRPMHSVFIDDNQLLIAGNSSSSISGNKSENSRGSFDAWILNVNITTGEIIWQKTIGGSQADGARFIVEEAEYFKVFCASESPVSGDKTVGTFGDYDIWIFDLSKSVGLEENDVLKRQVYPNPSAGFFHVSLVDGETARIYDLQGKEIAFKFENGMLDLSTLHDGIYLLNIEKTDAEREIIRLVKTN